MIILVTVMLLLATSAALLSCCVAIPSEYHHMAFVGFRRHEPRTTTPLAPPTQPDTQYDSSELADPEVGNDYGVQERMGEVSLPVDTKDLAAVPRANSESPRQAPYSYYYIGRKLWYVPLYFSLYFIFYVGALIIRAIARHKVTFPSRLPTARSSSASERSIQTEEARAEELDQASLNLNTILDDMMLKYM